MAPQEKENAEPVPVRTYHAHNSQKIGIPEVQQWSKKTLTQKECAQIGQQPTSKSVYTAASF